MGKGFVRTVCSDGDFEELLHRRRKQVSMGVMDAWHYEAATEINNMMLAVLECSQDFLVASNNREYTI